jgi:hypothetical protein
MDREQARWLQIVYFKKTPQPVITGNTITGNGIHPIAMYGKEKG